MPFEVKDTASGRQYALTGTPHVFYLRDGGPPDHDPRRTPFDAALGSVAAFHDKQAAIESDKDLSPAGKAKRLDPERAALIKTLASAGADLDAIDADIAQAEARMYELPAVLPEMSAATATREALIQQLWAKLDMKGKAAAMQQMVANPKAHRETMVAIQRQPVLLRDDLSDRVADVWREFKRSEESAKYESLEAGRKAVDWSRAGLANLVGVSRRFIGWDGRQTLAAIVTAGDEKAQRGAGVFGFDQSDIALAKAQIEARKVSDKPMDATLTT